MLHYTIGNLNFYLKLPPYKFEFYSIKTGGKVVRDKIINYMEENGLFTKQQQRFRKVYSCVTQLIDKCQKNGHWNQTQTKTTEHISPLVNKNGALISEGLGKAHVVNNFITSTRRK